MGRSHNMGTTPRGVRCSSCQNRRTNGDLRPHTYPQQLATRALLSDFKNNSIIFIKNKFFIIRLLFFVLPLGHCVMFLSETVGKATQRNLRFFVGL